MSTLYTSQSASALPKTSSVTAIDSIKLTRIRVILRNVRLKSEDSSDVEMEHSNTSDNNSGGDDSTQKLKPFVLDLNLTGGLQQVSLTNVPLGTYDRFKFQIHKVNQTEIDSLSASEQAAFADFLNGGNYSIIIEGTTYKNNQATQFTYKSEINVEIEKTLNPPLTITQSQTTFNLTLEISSASWFVDQNNSLLDPTNPSNFTVIEHNLKSFLKVFKDNNHDGKEDND